LPGLIHEVSASWHGAARFKTKSLSINRPGSRPMMSTRHGESSGATVLTSPSPSRRGASLVVSVTPDGLELVAPPIHMPDQSRKSDSVTATHATGVWTNKGRPTTDCGWMSDKCCGLNSHSCEPLKPSFSLRPAKQLKSPVKENSVPSRSSTNDSIPGWEGSP